VEVPVLFATETAATEQVAAGVTAGETLQVSATVDELSPPEGVIVMVDFADAPGATEAGNSALAERPNPGAVIARLVAGDVLTL
jgi:hypothetical protein